jgi:hypothetical protein
MQLVEAFIAPSTVSTFDHLGDRWAVLNGQFWQKRQFKLQASKKTARL